MTNLIALAEEEGLGPPFRIQLSRKKGWRMPANTVKVDRSTRYGNPYTVELAKELGVCSCALCRVVLFERALSENGRAIIRENLAGKNLACWCSLDAYCHADILLMIANQWGDYAPVQEAVNG